MINLAPKQPWRPIETAPKDGTRLIGFFKHTMPDMQITIIKFSEKECSWLDDFEMAWTAPCFWQPLPQPPQEACDD
jgi:hypothetical protein